MENKIGVLWKKKKEKLEYLSGILEIEGKKINIVAFPARKESEKSPDFNILISEPKKEGKTETVKPGEFI